MVIVSTLSPKFNADTWPPPGHDPISSILFPEATSSTNYRISPSRKQCIQEERKEIEEILYKSVGRLGETNKGWWNIQG